MECPICVETTKNSYKCTFCDFECCKNCVETYAANTLSCMNCKFIISLPMVEVKKKFLNRVLVKEDKYMLESKKTIAMDKKIRALKSEKEYFKEVGFSIAIVYYNDMIFNMTISQFGICSDCGQVNFNNGKVIECPCGNNLCSICRDINDNGHKCKEEIASSSELIKKSSTGCPGCGASVTKVDGCYQIICTQCDTAFDYNTGEIDNGILHSPRVFELIHKFEKESKLKSVKWKEYFNNRIVNTLFNDLCDFIFKQSGKNINADNRIKMLLGKISISEYQKNTLNNYSKHLQQRSELMIRCQYAAEI